MHGESITPNTLPWQRKNSNHRPTPYARPNYAKPEQYQSRSENRSYFVEKVRTPSIELAQLKGYQDDNKEVVKILNSLHKESAIGKVLFIGPHNNKGLAYYETAPFCIKFDFSIDKESKIPPRDIDQRDLRIRGTFEFDRSKMSEYVNKHQPGAFRQLKLQKERGENIPIHMKGTSLHRAPDSIPHKIKVIEKKNDEA
ncbi:hypothetical protein GV64_13795 [Endozoicomonas elysicola]|uniref:Uncharacterized protein n=2 Tax=Endozoicomonas elysicola TaxID=305900 RepID=A0A081KBZ2_9GAMM|nr:hypothetical protein GV64_13795 [Endozoicomonas elysicola]